MFKVFFRMRQFGRANFPVMQWLRVFSPHVPCEISEANFRQFQWVFPLVLVDFQSISTDLLSFSVSLNQFQSILVSLTRSKTQEFIDNPKVGKTTRNNGVSKTCQTSEDDNADFGTPPPSPTASNKLTLCA